MFRKAVNGTIGKESQWKVHQGNWGRGELMASVRFGFQVVDSGGFMQK